MSKATADKIWAATKELEKICQELTSLRSSLQWISGTLNDIAIDEANDDPPILETKKDRRNSD